jgi:N-acetylneuraminic acid mutarotase
LHACVAFENNIYIFGGYDGVNRKNDFYKYNVETNTWTQVINNDSPPSPRDRHVASNSEFSLESP